MSVIEKTLDEQWEDLLNSLAVQIGKRPADLNSVLFLIGVQELGQGAKRFTKEQKQDLMHVGICTVLSISGYYQLEGRDTDGWPHFTPVMSLGNLNLSSQELLLRLHVLEYFRGLLS
jgi:hypothetical protein